MPTNQERSDIQAEINQYVYPDVTSPLSTTELDYILDKQGDYRKLAILEAARGIMVRKFYEPTKADIITGEIVALQDQIYKELKNTQAKESWHSKYDNMGYSQIINIASEVKEECPDCINGVRHSAFDNSAYPCSCGLGQKLSVTTNYMGPIRTPPTIPLKTNLANTVKVVPKLPDIPDIPKKTKPVSEAYNKLFGKKPKETLENSPVPKKAKKHPASTAHQAQCNHPAFTTHQRIDGTFAWRCSACSRVWTGPKEVMEKAIALAGEFPSTQEALGSYYTKAFITNLPVANVSGGQYKDYVGEYYATQPTQPGQPAAPVSTPLQVEEEPQGRKFRNARTE